MSLPPELNPGEQILWKGQPNYKPMMGDRVKLWLPMLGIWFLISCIIFIPIITLWDGMQFNFDGSLKTILMAIMSVCIYLAIPGMVVFEICIAKYRARNTYYYITNQRVIIRYGLVRVNQTNFAYDHITSVQLKEGRLNYKHGTRTIEIYTRLSNLRSVANEVRNGRATVYYDDSIPRFKNIEDYRTAYDLLRQYIDASK